MVYRRETVYSVLPEYAHFDPALATELQRNSDFTDDASTEIIRFTAHSGDGFFESFCGSLDVAIAQVVEGSYDRLMEGRGAPAVDCGLVLGAQDV